MPLLIDLLLALGAGTLAALLSLRHARRVPGGRPTALAHAREAGAALGERPHAHHVVDNPLGPKQLTGVALSIALAVTVAGGVLLGVLAYLVRSDRDLADLDATVARWGDRHATGFSSDALDVITFVGQPSTILGLAALLAIAETVRTRDRWVVPFVLLVVVGNGTLTTIVKNLMDRVRPAFNPIAETLGPSFPSGHSSWAAAFFACLALLLSRGRPPRTRALLAGIGVGVPVAVAASRVLLDVHWLSDVVAGLALGWAWFSLCAIAFGGRVLRFGAPARVATAAAEGGVSSAASRAAPARSSTSASSPARAWPSRHP